MNATATDILFYLMVVPVAILSVFQIRWALHARKHDRILFPICELRSELHTWALREWEAGRLNRNDYLYARLMLATMNNTVGLYRDHRKRMFNLRELRRFILRYGASVRRIIGVPRTENVELRSIEQRLVRAQISGFMAYTPFLASEIVLRVIIAVCALLARTGLTWFSRRLDELQELYSIVTQQAQTIGEFSKVRYA